MVDDGVEGALLVIGRPPPLNAGVRLGGHVVFQHLHQTRFADAGLAAEQYHLPHPCWWPAPSAAAGVPLLRPGRPAGSSRAA